MNILDVQDNLKNLPEQALMQEMQRPTGSAPQFLVLGELKRRKQMRDDYNRQQNSDMKTVAEEVVTAAGAPQEGIMQMARSLNPNTNMAQDTGLAQAAPVTPTQAPQPQAPQMMSDGGIMRLKTGGTISAIANLKVNHPDIYEEYKDDPEALAMVAEYFNFPATDSERTGLESIEAPYTDPYGPQGLAQRTAAAEVGNQARMASADAQQTEIDRMLGINAPLGSGRSGAPLDAAARRRIAEEDMAMAVPVPRDDFRTFPVDAPLTRDEKILADARAAIEKYGTNAGRDAEGNLLPVAPDYELTRAIEQRKRDEADEFFFNAGMFDRAAPENVAAQPRGSELPTEDAARNERLASGDIDLPFGLGSGSAEAPTPKDNRRGYDAPASQGLRDLLAEREAYAADTAAREARVAEASSGPNAVLSNISSAIEYGRENLPDLAPFVGQTKEAFSDPAAAFNREMAARQATGDRNYANAVQGVEALNQRIADANAAGDEILAQQLTTARDQLAGTLRDRERATDVTEAVLTVPQSINEAFQRSSLGVGLRGPDATAQTLTELAAEQEAAVEAEAARELRLAELLGGATPTSTAAAKAAQEEFSQRPDTQDVKPAAQQREIDAAIAGTAPVTAPVTTKDTGGAGFGSMDSRIAQMLSNRQKEAESDKWMALAQTGMALMASKNPTLGGALGEAGLAGIGALQKSKQGARAFETDMLKLQTSLDIAQQRARSSGARAKSIPATALTNAYTMVTDAQERLNNAQSSAEKFSASQDLEAAQNRFLQIQNRFDSQYGVLPTAAVGSGRKQV